MSKSHSTSASPANRCAWKGIFVELATPFHEDERLDLKSLVAQAEFVAETGADGIVVCSRHGEADKLSIEERLRVAATVLEKLKQRTPVLVDVCAPSNYLSVELAKHAKDHGAAGILASPRLETTFTDSQVQIYFDELDAAVGLPVMVLDTPPASTVTLSSHLIANLFPEIGSVVAVKVEARPTSTKINAIARLEPSLAIFAAHHGARAADELSRGARGIICSAALSTPSQQVESAFRTGDLEGALRANSQCAELVGYLEQSEDFAHHCAKRLLHCMGVLDTSVVRRPTCPFDERNERELLRIAGECGAIPGGKTARG
ncbi:MAG: dihydrodipicolinate synthase family protein [Planctomycetes bacterium]|nr:dihydrodipicolinate synthase family protein [Planctomycetota bacterium]